LLRYRWFSILLIPMIAATFLLADGSGEKASIQVGPIKTSSLVAFSPEAIYGDMGGEASSIHAYLTEVERVRLADEEWYAGVQRAIDEAARPKPVSRSTASVTPADGDILDRLAQCECGGNPGCNTGNGYYGTFQFLPGTWTGIGGEGMPNEATYEEQKYRAGLLIERSGWGQFPGCAARLGMR
jgi:resuscitation-promoting factor RpfB